MNTHPLRFALLFLLLAAPVSAQTTGYTVAYFPATTGVSQFSPLAAATQLTLTVAPTGLAAGSVILIDRVGTPELNTVASVVGQVLTLATPTLAAHTTPIVEWVATGAAPLTPTAVTATCASAVPPVGVVVPVNPTTLAWDDPASPTQVCVANVPAFFSSVPVGNWFVEVQGSPSLGWSNPAPFGRVLLLAVPTHLRIVR